MPIMTLPKIIFYYLLHNEICHFQKNIQGHKTLKHKFRRMHWTQSQIPKKDPKANKDKISKEGIY